MTMLDMRPCVCATPMPVASLVHGNTFSVRPGARDSSVAVPVMSPTPLVSIECDGCGRTLRVATVAGLLDYLNNDKRLLCEFARKGD
jgi:hypothetical protein